MAEYNEENPRRTLYNNLKADGYDIESFSRFTGSIDTKDGRRTLYDNLKADGYELGSYEEFSKRLTDSGRKVGMNTQYKSAENKSNAVQGVADAVVNASQSAQNAQRRNTENGGADNGGAYTPMFDMQAETNRPGAQAEAQYMPAWVRKQTPEAEKERKERMKGYANGAVNYASPMGEQMQMAEDVRAEQNLRKSDVDAFYDSEIKADFDDYYRQKEIEAHSKMMDELSKTQPMPASPFIGGYNVAEFGNMVSANAEYDRAMDPQAVIENVMGNATKKDSFGNLVMKRIGLSDDEDAQRKSAENGGDERALTYDEKVQIENYYQKEAGEIAKELQQRMMDEYSKKMAPKNVLEYIGGTAFHESLVGTVIDALISKANGSSGLRRQLRQKAYADYGEKQANMVERVIANTMPLIVDAPVFGGIGKGAGAVAQGALNKAVGKSAARALLTNSFKTKLGMGMLRTGMTFGTYDMSKEAAAQAMNPDGYDASAVMERGLSGFITGAAMGTSGAVTAELTKGLSGWRGGLGKALGFGAEVSVLTGVSCIESAIKDGVDIVDIDWSKAGEEWLNSAGTILILKGMGAVEDKVRRAATPGMDAPKYKYDMELKDAHKKYLEKVYGLKFDSERDIIESCKKLDEPAREDAAPTGEKSIVLRNADGKAEQTLYEKIMNDPNAPINLKRNIAYIETGKIFSPSLMADYKYRQLSNGNYQLATFDNFNRVIDVEEVTKSELVGRLKDIEVERDKAGVEASINLMQTPYAYVKQAARTYSKDNGMAFDEVADIVERSAQGEELSDAENAIVNQIMGAAAQFAEAYGKLTIDSVHERIQEQTGVDTKKLLESGRDPRTWTKEERRAMAKMRKELDDAIKWETKKRDFEDATESAYEEGARTEEDVDIRGLIEDASKKERKVSVAPDSPTPSDGMEGGGIHKDVAAAKDAIDSMLANKAEAADVHSYISGLNMSDAEKQNLAEYYESQKKLEGFWNHVQAEIDNAAQQERTRLKQFEIAELGEGIPLSEPQIVSVMYGGQKMYVMKQSRNGDVVLMDSEGNKVIVGRENRADITDWVSTTVDKEVEKYRSGMQKEVGADINYAMGRHNPNTVKDIAVGLTFADKDGQMYDVVAVDPEAQSAEVVIYDGEGAQIKAVMPYEEMWGVMDEYWNAQEPRNRQSEADGTMAEGADGTVAGGVSSAIAETVVDDKPAEAVSASDDIKEVENDVSVTYMEDVRLSDEKNEYGKSFVISKDGSTTFGEISEEDGLTPAPIKLNEGENYIGEDGKNHGYGLRHIEVGHGEQIRNAGFASVQDFVEEVARNFDTIREGNKIADKQTYLLEVSDEHNNTLFIELSKDGTYWNVNSAGIFKVRYSKNKKKVNSLPTIGDSANTDTTGVNHGQENGAAATSENSPSTSEKKDKGSTGGSMNIDPEPEGKQNGTVPLQTSISDSKGTEISANDQTISEENAPKEKKKYDTKHEKMLKEMGDEYNTLEEWVLRQMGGGKVKFRWKSRQSGTGGVGAHTTGESNRSEMMQKASMLDATNGTTPEEYAEYIYDNIPENLKEYDVQDVSNMVIDTLNSYNGFNQMVEAAYQIHQDAINREREAEEEHNLQLRDEDSQSRGFADYEDERLSTEARRKSVENAMAKMKTAEAAQYLNELVMRTNNAQIRYERTPSANNRREWYLAYSAYKTGKNLYDSMARMSDEEGWFGDNAQRKSAENGGNGGKKYVFKVDERTGKVRYTTVNADGKTMLSNWAEFQKARKAGVEGVPTKDEISKAKKTWQLEQLKKQYKEIDGAQTAANAHEAIEMQIAEGNLNEDEIRALALKSEDMRLMGELWNEVGNVGSDVQMQMESTPEQKAIDNRKKAQLDIILKSNPKDPNLSDHAWVEDANDILTYAEAVDVDKAATPDYTDTDIDNALESGKVTVYSSYPIADGVFVTPSKMEAQSYAGEGKVYSKVVKLDDVAWIDTLQGQYAKVDLHGVVVQKSLQDESLRTGTEADYHQGDIAKILNNLYLASTNEDNIALRAENNTEKGKNGAKNNKLASKQDAEKKAITSEATARAVEMAIAANGGKVHRLDEKSEKEEFAKITEEVNLAKKKGKALEERVSGDRLLDAQDLIEEIKQVGAEVDKNGYVTLYHRGTAEEIAAIKNSGIMKAKENGLFFSTSENGANNSGYGNDVLVLKVPAEELTIDDIFNDEASVRLPLKGKKWEKDVSEWIVNNNTQLMIGGESYDAPSAQVFYSNAERGVEAIKQEKASGEQWLNMLKKNGGLKAEEDKWIGLSDFLGGKKSVTKQEVLEYIAENKLQVADVRYANDVVLHDVLDEYNKRFAEYVDEAAEELGGNSVSADWYKRAYERMEDEEGDDFRNAMMYDENTGRLEPVRDIYGNLTGEAEYYLTSGEEQSIDSTRLEYTTEGLNNKREIALVVPTIDPYKENDTVHFGDAGEGRAVAWVRFGDATDTDGNKVLVIDEIQSKRHQDGREKGYKSKEFSAYKKQMREKYGNNYLIKMTNDEAERYVALSGKISGVPDAPFQKNWHELAMKRMLRYAAENGYDKVAWTTGMQQAARYAIGGVIGQIEIATGWRDGRKRVALMRKDGIVLDVLKVGDDGSVESNKAEFDNKMLDEIVGKELTDKIMNAQLDEDGRAILTGTDLEVGGEGMKGFYDQMLPRFMNKYGKKWGVKVGEVELDLPNETDRMMWSADVTDAMRESVMEGQPMFMKTSKGVVYGWQKGNDVYLTRDGINPDTPAHEYTHLWAKAVMDKAPELWVNIKDLLKGTPMWERVMADKNYSNIHGNEDKVASEVLSRLSGKKNQERIEAEFDKMREEAGEDIVESAKVENLINRMKKALSQFWEWVGKNLFGIKKFKDVDEVTDRVLYDLYNKTDLKTGDKAQQAQRRNAENGGGESKKEREVSTASEKELKNKYKEQKTEELIVSLVDKNGKVDYEKAREIGRRVASGETRVRTEDRRILQTTSGIASQAIQSIFRGIAKASKGSLGEVGIYDSALQGSEGEVSETERAAKRLGVWYDEKEVSERLTDGTGAFKKGSEASVYYGADGKSVIKVANVGRHGNMPQYLRDIDAFNSVFGEAAYEVIGFTKIKDNQAKRYVVAPIIKQKYFDNPTLWNYSADEGKERHWDEDEISDMMEQLGFEPSEGYGSFENELYVVEDVHSANVMRLSDGRMVVIDADVKAKDDGMLGGYIYEDVASGEDGIQFSQVRDIDTPQFKNWFGDWENDPKNASKVVERDKETGEMTPKAVYHGTTNGKFSIFDKERVGEKWDADERGFFFTDSEAIGKEYTTPVPWSREPGNPYLFKVYLNIKKPLTIDARWFRKAYGERISEYDAIEIWDVHHEDILKEFDKGDYDGVIIDPSGNGASEPKMYVAFEPNQVKSAEENNGDYSPENDDINFMIELSDEGNRELWEKAKYNDADKIILVKQMGGAVTYGKDARILAKELGRETDNGSLDLNGKELMDAEEKYGDGIKTVEYGDEGTEYGEGVEAYDVDVTNRNAKEMINNHPEAIRLRKEAFDAFIAHKIDGQEESLQELKDAVQDYAEYLQRFADGEVERNVTASARKKFAEEVAKCEAYIDELDMGIVKNPQDKIGLAQKKTSAATSKGKKEKKVKVVDSIGTNATIMAFAEDFKGETFKIGNNSVTLSLEDSERAKEMSRTLPKMDVHRGWEDGALKKVVVHTSAPSLKSKYPEIYRMAKKEGSSIDAYNLCKDIVKEQEMARMKLNFPNAKVVFPHVEADAGQNKLASVYAEELRRYGFDIDDSVVMKERVNHTGASSLQRLTNRARFEGEIEKYGQYIIVDDFITSGAQVRDLKDYIESNEGQVVLVSSLATGRYGTFLQPREEDINKLKELGVNDEQLQVLGIANSTEDLTAGEVRRLISIASRGTKQSSRGADEEVRRNLHNNVHAASSGDEALDTQLSKEGYQDGSDRRRGEEGGSEGLQVGEDRYVGDLFSQPAEPARPQQKARGLAERLGVGTYEDEPRGSAADILARMDADIDAETDILNLADKINSRRKAETLMSQEDIYDPARRRAQRNAQRKSIENGGRGEVRKAEDANNRTAENGGKENDAVKHTEAEGMIVDNPVTLQTVFDEGDVYENDHNIIIIRKDLNNYVAYYEKKRGGRRRHIPYGEPRANFVRYLNENGFKKVDDSRAKSNEETQSKSADNGGVSAEKNKEKKAKVVELKPKNQPDDAQRRNAENDGRSTESGNKREVDSGKSASNINVDSAAYETQLLRGYLRKYGLDRFADKKSFDALGYEDWREIQEAGFAHWDIHGEESNRERKEFLTLLHNAWTREIRKRDKELEKLSWDITLPNPDQGINPDWSEEYVKMLVENQKNADRATKLRMKMADLRRLAYGIQSRVSEEVMEKVDDPLDYATFANKRNWGIDEVYRFEQLVSNPANATYAVNSLEEIELLKKQITDALYNQARNDFKNPKVLGFYDKREKTVFVFPQKLKDRGKVACAIAHENGHFAIDMLNIPYKDLEYMLDYMARNHFNIYDEIDRGGYDWWERGEEAAVRLLEKLVEDYGIQTLMTCKFECKDEIVNNIINSIIDYWKNGNAKSYSLGRRGTANDSRESSTIGRMEGMESRESGVLQHGVPRRRGLEKQEEDNRGDERERSGLGRLGRENEGEGVFRRRLEDVLGEGSEDDPSDPRPVYPELEEGEELYSESFLERERQYHEDLRAWKERNRAREERTVAEALLSGDASGVTTPTGVEATDVEAADEAELFDGRMNDAKIDVSKEGMKRMIKDEILERRRTIETSNLEDALTVHDIKKVTTAEQRKQIPFLLEDPEEAALQTPEMKEVLQKIRDWFDDVHRVLTEEGLFTRSEQESYIENYVTHIWDFERSDPKTVADMRNWIRMNTPYVKGRIISTLKEGLDKGLKMKYDDITDIMLEYGHYATEAIANRRLVNFLKGFKMDGMPILVSDDEKDADYVRIDNNALDGLKVYKGAKPMLDVVFGKLHTSDNVPLQNIAHVYDVLGGVMKKINLSLSFFHHAALTETAVSMMGVPKFSKALFKNMIWDAATKGELPAFLDREATKDAVKHFVSLGATQDYAAKEVQAVTANIRQILNDKNIPVLKELSAIPDWLNKGMDLVLWDWLHDGYKVYAYKKIADEIRRMAQKQEWEDRKTEMALDEAGQLVNDTFGGQHWDLLGWSPNTVKWARRALLSPDWTISTIRQALAPFGIGQLYNDDRFWKKWFKNDNVANVRKKYGRAFWLYAFLAFIPFYNMLNAYFRRKDEEDELAKAEEMRKENPDYKSPYELAYPNGMKWWDYTMLGNTMGQQTHLFTGRYSNGDEMYLRWGKQFRELPELFFGRDGFSIPGPMIDKMAGKLNPLLNTSVNIVSGFSLTGWENPYMKNRRGWEKEWGRVQTLIASFMPYSIPTDAEKEFVLSDLLMPSTKGFSNYKARRGFETAIKSGDVDLVGKVYEACVKNGLDADKILDATINMIKATARQEMIDGIEDVSGACKMFDEIEDPTKRKQLKNYIEKMMSAQDWHQIRKDEVVRKAEEIINGENVDASNVKMYDKLQTSDDVIGDWKLKKALSGLKQWKDEYNRIKFEESGKAAEAYKKEHKKIFDKIKDIEDARRKINKEKNKLQDPSKLKNQTQDDLENLDINNEKTMIYIRQIRNRVLDEE